MKKNPITEAIKKAAGGNAIGVHTIEVPEPKKTKKSKGNEFEIPYYSKPSLYLDDKDLPAISGYKVGDKVMLVVEAEVRSMNKDERMKDGKPETSYSVSLEINAFADITK